MKPNRPSFFSVAAASLAAVLASTSAFAAAPTPTAPAAAPKLSEKRDADLATTQVTWTAPSDDVTSYLLQQAANPQFNTLPGAPVKTLALPQTLLSMTFWYLELPREAGTSYMRVRAKYATGVGPWSNVIVLKNPCQLTQAPKRVRAKLTNAKDLSAGVDLSWDGVAAQTSCPPVEYHVQITVNGASGRPFGKVQSGKQHMPIMPGSSYFLPGTAYTFQVCAVYERWKGKKVFIDESPMSTGVQLTTPK